MSCKYKIISLLQLVPSGLTQINYTAMWLFRDRNLPIESELSRLNSSSKVRKAMTLLSGYYRNDINMKEHLVKFFWVSNVQFLSLIENEIPHISNKEIEEWLVLNALQHLPLKYAHKLRVKNVSNILNQLPQIKKLQRELNTLAKRIPDEILFSDLMIPDSISTKYLSKLKEILPNQQLQLFFLAQIITFQTGLRNNHLTEKKGLELSTLFLPLVEEYSLFALRREIMNHKYEQLYPEKTREVLCQIKQQWGVSYYELYDRLDSVHQLIEEKLKKLGIRAKVISRVKAILSIVKKMERHHINMYDVHDLMGLTIVMSPGHKFKRIRHQIIKKVGLLKKTRKFESKKGYSAIHYRLQVSKARIPLEIKVQSERGYIIAEVGPAKHSNYKKEQDRRHKKRRG
jgi:hypothetical protein